MIKKWCSNISSYLFSAEKESHHSSATQTTADDVDTSTRTLHPNPFVKEIKQIRFIGEKCIPYGTRVKDTPVGGISGIDYNSESNHWVLVSDDHSERSPARFYTAALSYNTNQFLAVTLSDVTFLKQPDGTLYPSESTLEKSSVGKKVVPDIESIRIDPITQQIWYTSEGVKDLGLKPLIRQADRQGMFLSSFPLPDRFTPEIQTKKGVRKNRAMEGTSFTPDGQYYFICMEAPLIQDGGTPTPERGGYSRISQYDRSGNIISEFAYPLDPVPTFLSPIKTASNGVAEILSINPYEFLVLERATIQNTHKKYKNSIRLFQISTRGATDIKDLPKLKNNTFQTVSKKLIIDLDTLNLSHLDNIEGMAWGPELSNGHGSLILISDNNFNPSQVTQFLAFDVEWK